MTAPAHPTVAIVSPHLDDAALSLGATIAMLTRRGVDVRVVTVFAGDPDYTGSPSPWDAFRHSGDASAVFAARREEDRQACAALGAQAVWLDHLDDLYHVPRDRAAIWRALHTAAGDADVVLVPGYPLAHPDHRFIADLVRAHASELGCVLSYCELPYAILPRTLWSRVRAGGWYRPRVARADRAAKRVACEWFSHEIAQFGFSARLAQRCGSPISLESVQLVQGELPEGLRGVLG